MAKGLFDEMWNASVEAIKSLKRPFVRNSIKRRFESAIDDASKKIIDCKLEVQKEYEKFSSDPESFDLNVVILKGQEISDLESTRSFIVSEYIKVFGTEPKVIEDETDEERG